MFSDCFLSKLESDVSIFDIPEIKDLNIEKSGWQY